MSPVRAVSGPAELARDAADEVLLHGERALELRGIFHLALSGGSTPRATYAELARRARAPRGRALDSSRWRFWFADERCGAPDDPASNYRLVRETLFEPAGIPESCVRRMRGEDDPERAAEDYARALSRELGSPPRIDLVLLGLGADGHTASLFPGSPALEERERPVVAVPAPAGDLPRLTLTLPVLDAARAVLFLVTGAEKAAALRRALRASGTEEAPPAARVRPRDGEVLWLADRAALGSGGDG